MGNHSEHIPLPTFVEFEERAAVIGPHGISELLSRSRHPSFALTNREAAAALLGIAKPYAAIFSGDAQNETAFKSAYTGIHLGNAIGGFLDNRRTVPPYPRQYFRQADQIDLKEHITTEGVTYLNERPCLGSWISILEGIAPDFDLAKTSAAVTIKQIEDVARRKFIDETVQHIIGNSNGQIM